MHARFEPHDADERATSAFAHGEANGAAGVPIRSAGVGESAGLRPDEELNGTHGSHCSRCAREPLTAFRKVRGVGGLDGG